MGMNFYLGDVYPNHPMTTRLMTVAEPDDQQALVDDEQLAQDNPAKLNPAKPKPIWFSIVVILVIVAFLSAGSK